MEGYENGRPPKEPISSKESTRLIFLHTIVLGLVLLSIYVIQLLLKELLGDNAKLFDLIPIQYITVFISLVVLAYYVASTRKAFKERQ